MIAIELTAAIDNAGTTQTFYLSTDSFATSPSDTPANTAFLPVLIDPGSIGIHVYSDGRTGGATRLETGEIVIANADGQFDDWLNYSFDGRAVTIRSGTSGSYPSAFPAVLVGTVESIEADWKRIVIRLRDKQYLFEKSALSTRYAGSNSLPNGLEGTASDIKGKVKPKAYGKVLNVAPPMVNSSRLIYEVGVCNSVDAIYDQGLALTAGSAYSNQADMETNAPSAGQYRVWAAGGYVRLGSTPAGLITMDVTQGASSANRTVAQILKQLALDAGLSSGEISSGDVTALDSASNAVVGIWLNDETTSQSAMDQVAASIGAWYGFDATGTLRIGQLTAPSGSAVVTLYDYDIGEAIERRPPKDNNIPVWRVTLNHSRIWTVQPSDLAGAVSAATRAYLAEEWRSVKDEDATVKTQWLLATEINADGLLTSSSDAATETTRRLTLYKARRDVFDVPVSIDILTANSLKLMDVVGLEIARFGMGSGKSFHLIGITLDLTRGQAILTLWG
jgi:hypothetical protein